MLDPSVPKGLCVALYKGTRPGIEGIYNRLGRFLDRGPYSHAELKFPNGLSASSSFMDKGVRTKQINYSSVGYWDFLPLPTELEAKTWDWFRENDGKKYDILGNLRFASNFFRDSSNKWFCSEAIMAALGFYEPYRYGPSGLATTLTHHFNTKIVLIEDTYPH